MPRPTPQTLEDASAIMQTINPLVQIVRRLPIGNEKVVLQGAIDDLIHTAWWLQGKYEPDFERYEGRPQFARNA